MDLNLDVLAPFQEGLHDAAESEVLSEGARLVRQANLETFRTKLRENWLEGNQGATDALQKAQTDLETAKAANRRVLEEGQRWMKAHALQPDDRSIWSEEMKTMMEGGLFCPIDCDPDDVRTPPAEINRTYVSMLKKLQEGSLSEMPILSTEFYKTAKGGGTDATEGPQGYYDNLGPEAKKMAQLLWALKVHKGEQRMHAGTWVKTQDSTVPPWAGSLKLTAQQLEALERRTHFGENNEDPCDPVLFTQEDVEAQIRAGHRPAPDDITGVFWASNNEGNWYRRTRTWTLPALVHVYGHRYPFRFIYAAWCEMPITIPSHQRGKDAPSRRESRVLNFKMWASEAKSFVQLAGVPEPTSKEEWSELFREMGRFMATKSFLVHTPPCVMQMEVQPVHDSKDALRFRAQCDERITLPLSAFDDYPEIQNQILASIPQGSMLDIKVNWRCNVPHVWAAAVPESQAAALYLKIPGCRCPRP